MAQHPFVGAWRLVSCELRSADGQVSYPLGQDALGYIMYSDDGYMSVAFMGANRPQFASGHILGGTAEEKVAAHDTYQSYCGRYEIQGDRVVHHIEVSSFPNWTGVDQERCFTLEGNRLSPSTPSFLVAGMQQAAHLIWERL
jgi:hypothetical protein